jgi:ABC-2 type transport system ATP-binding protein
MTLLRERATQDGHEDAVETKNSSVQLDTKDSIELIKVRDLVRQFGSFTAVASTSFSVRRGEIFGLLGPNGAGRRPHSACFAACSRRPVASSRWRVST